MDQKWRKYANLTYIFVALTFAHLIWASPLAGTAEPSEMSKPQFTAFIVFIAVECVTLILLFFFAIRCRLCYNRSMREQRKMLETVYRSAYECRADGLARYDCLVEVRYFDRYTQRIVICMRDGLYRYDLEWFQSKEQGWKGCGWDQVGYATLQEAYGAIEDFKNVNYDEVIEKRCAK